MRQPHLPEGRGGGAAEEGVQARASHLGLKLGTLRIDGKLNDKLQTEIKAGYDKQQRGICKRLNEQIP